MRRIALLLFFTALSSPAAAEGIVPHFSFAPEVEREPPPPPPPCERCRKLVESLERGCAVGATVPYADTVLLRRRLDPLDDPEARMAVALAVASSDIDWAERELGPFIDADSAVTRYVAALHLALVAQRAGRLDDPAMERALRTMREAAPSVDFPVSDIAFFDALRAERLGDDEAALAHALDAAATEPQFFNALALALLIQVKRTTSEERRSRNACGAAYDTLLDILSRIADIEPCKRFAAHVEQLIAREFTQPRDVAAFSAAQTYLALISRRPEMAAGSAARFAATSGPVCRADVAYELDQLLESAEQGDGGG
jgi:hypothetical protein